MRLHPHISRAYGLLMFMMVMLTSVFGKQLPHHHESKKVEQKQTDKKQKPANQVVVSEVSLEVVVPSHAFDFGHDAIILPTPKVIYVIVETTVKTFTKPLYRLSYFDKLYEHHIAPNAP